MAAQLNDAISPPSQSMLHAVQRHRDVLQDYTRDFARTKVSWNDTLFSTDCVDPTHYDGRITCKQLWTKRIYSETSEMI